MGRDFATLADRAREHQRDLDAKTRYLSVTDLAARWGVAGSTVREIPKEDLPYMPVGKGKKAVHRRYHPDDVDAYERKYRPQGVAA